MKHAPETPDPYTTANAQSQSNIDTARATQGLNMVNQVNPYGSLTYTRRPSAGGSAPLGGMGMGLDGAKGSGMGMGGGSSEPGEYTATTTLDPAQQALLDQSNKDRLGAGGIASQFLSGGQGAFSGKGLDLSYGNTESRLNDLAAKRLDPMWADNSRHQEDVLASRGITPGTPAYDNAMRVFNQGKNDAYNSSQLQSHQQAVSDLTSEYNSPLQSYGALTGMSQPTNFQPMNTPNANVAGTNISGLIEDNYKQQSANANAQNGQIAGLIGTGLGAVMGGPLGASLGGAAMGGLFGGGSPSGYGR